MFANPSLQKPVFQEQVSIKSSRASVCFHLGHESVYIILRWRLSGFERIDPLVRNISNVVGLRNEISSSLQRQVFHDLWFTEMTVSVCIFSSTLLGMENVSPQFRVVQGAVQWYIGRHGSFRADMWQCSKVFSGFAFGSLVTGKVVGCSFFRSSFRQSFSFSARLGLLEKCAADRTKIGVIAEEYLLL